MQELGFFSNIREIDDKPALEEWRIIAGFDNYMVSSIGRVKRLGAYVVDSGSGRKRFFPEKTLKPVKIKIGYMKVSLSVDGKPKQRHVHRLVAGAFIQKIGPVVNHKDGDKTNNNVENLEWTTSRGNCIHAYKTGLNPRGVARDMSKAEISSIRELYIPKKFGEGRISVKLNIPKRKVRAVIRGNHYMDSED